jgi:hypothetical protein
MGFQKNIENMMIFSTPTPLWIELSCGRELDFHFLIRCVFGSLLGLILEVFWEAKWRSKPLKSHLKKTSKKTMPKMTQNWSQRGSQNGAKIIKNEVLEAPCFKDGSQEASRPPPGSILERFWDHFGTMFVSFSNILIEIFASIL